MKRLTRLFKVLLAGLILAAPILSILPVQNVANAVKAPLRNLQPAVKTEQIIAWDDPASPYRMVLYGTPPTANYSVILDMALATSANLSALIADGRVRFFQSGHELPYYITSNTTPSTATFVVNVGSNTTGHWEMYWGGPSGNHQTPYASVVGTTNSHVQLYEPFWALGSNNQTLPSWTGLEPAGKTTTNYSGNSLPLWLKSGFSFNGSAQGLNITPYASGFFPTNNFTILGRFQTSNTSAIQGIIATSNGPLTYQTAVTIQSGPYLAYYSFNGSNRQRRVSGVDTNWHNFAAISGTADVGVQSLYMDSTLYQSTSGADGYGVGGVTRVAAQHPFYGVISEIIVYDSPITDTANLTSIYNVINWRHIPSNITYSSTSVSVNTLSPSIITTTWAIIGGNLTSLGMDTTVNATIDWGIAVGSLTNHTPTQILDAIGTYTANISGLSTNTTYYYRASANGTTTLTSANGSVNSFRTAFMAGDYFYAYTTDNGSLEFANKSTGTFILTGSPVFYMNYGSITTTNVSPLNPSFEVGSPPSNWSYHTPANTTMNSSGAHVYSGSASLSVNMTGSSGADPRRVYSSLIPIAQDKGYQITYYTYYATLTTGPFTTFYIAWYPNADGSGTETDLGYGSLTGVIGSWVTNNITWNPPWGARSFKLFFYTDGAEVSSLFYDAVSVLEVTHPYQINSPSGIQSSIATSGDNITVTSTDDTNTDVTVSHIYNLNLHSPEVTYQPTITRKNQVLVYEERFDFTIPTTSASIMTRDLVLNTFNTSNMYWSDLLTPKVVKFNNGLQFLSSDNTEAMRLRSLQSGISQLSFYTNYSQGHPFSYVTKTTGVGVDISSENYTAGSNYSPIITFLIDTNNTYNSLVKTKQPYGYDATLIFTDHTDDATLAATAAEAMGTNNLTSTTYGTKGITGNGLGYTRSVWIQGSYLTLQNTAYKSLIDQMYSLGTEIVLHSPTSNTDSRTLVDAAATNMTLWYHTRDWIDHGATGGTGNYEDLKSQGTIKGDANYSLDLFANHNINYSWSYIDWVYGTSGGATVPANSGLNMLSPNTTSVLQPWFYYNRNVDDNPGSDTPIYLWSTVNTVNREDIYYAQSYVDSLISQRGISIGHDYIANPGSLNHAFWVNPATGDTEVYPAFETALEYIKSKVTSQNIWSPTVAQGGDYWRALIPINIKRISSQVWQVTNNGANTMPAGLTLLFENNITKAATQTGGTLLYSGIYGTKEVVIPTTIPAGQSINVMLNFDNPSASTTPITNVSMNGGTHATLNANVAGLGTATTINAYFQWGTDGVNWPNSTPVQTISSTGNIQASITGYNPQNSLHSRIVYYVGDTILYGVDQSTIPTPTGSSSSGYAVISVVSLIFGIVVLSIILAVIRLDLSIMEKATLVLTLGVIGTVGIIILISLVHTLLG